MTFFEYNIPNGKSYNQKVLGRINFFLRFMRKNSALAHLLTKFLLQRIQRFQGSLLRLKVFWDFPMRLGELLRLSYLDKNYSNREKLQECTHFEKAYPFSASLFLEPSIIFNCHLQ